MIATIIFDRAGFLQNESDASFRRHRHVPVAVTRGCGVRENVPVDPFDGVADLGRDLRRRNHQIFHRDLNRRRVRRDGHPSISAATIGEARLGVMSR